MLLTQLLQEHLARPLGAAIPACSGPVSAADDIIRKTSAGTLQTTSALALAS